MQEKLIKSKTNTLATLYCKDCSDVFSLLEDNSVDLILTDPPYGIDYRSNRQRVDRKKSVSGEGSIVIRNHYFSKIENDTALSLSWISDAYRVLKNNSAMYIFSHWTKWGIMQQIAEQSGFSVKNMIVLNKSNHGMGDLSGSFAPKHELLMYAVKGKPKLNFPEGRISDVWNVPVKFSGSKRLHPNEKPISWIEPIILNSSVENSVVFDPFMGSGTTGEAAILGRRQFIGCEIDDGYFDIACQRLAGTAKKTENNIF